MHMAGGAQGLSRTLHRPRQAPQPIGRTLRRMISSARVRVSLIRCEAKYRIAPLLCPVSPTASHHPRPNSRQRCDYHNRPPARSVAPLGSASVRARARPLLVLSVARGYHDGATGKQRPTSVSRAMSAPAVSMAAARRSRRHEVAGCRGAPVDAVRLGCMP